MALPVDNTECVPRPAVWEMSQTSSVPGEAKTVYVLDGDEGVRNALVTALGALDVQVETFTFGRDFLRHVKSESGTREACLVTEARLPDMTGAELQETLHRLGVTIPVIVVATTPVVPEAVRAMRLGALDFIEKPFIGRRVVSRVSETLGLTPARRGAGGEAGLAGPASAGLTLEAKDQHA